MAYSLEGRRILLVEDEMLIAFLIEEMLEELGCAVAIRAVSLPDAMSAAESTDADLAILDVNLAGTEVFPAAEILAERGIPFIFSTGYGVNGLEDRWRSRPVIHKPYGQRALGEALRLAGESSKQQ